MLNSKVQLNYITYEFLMGDKPFSIGRIGNVEGSSLTNNGANRQLWSNAGFYGNMKQFEQWKKIYIESIKDCDVLAYVYTCNSFFTAVGDTLTSLKIYKPMIPYFEFPEFYLKFMEVLSKQNKKIGIISSFYKDILEQSKKINLIYPNFKINPDMFVIIESYNTCNDNVSEGHKNWEFTLNDLGKRVLEHRDVNHWFISCGCYGLPLQSILKKNGKNSIYVGGLLQILFGIMGKRWDTRPEVIKNVNIHWKTSQYLDIKTLSNLQNVESGCYL